MINKLLGIVPNASEHGRAVDHMLEVCHWFMLVLGAGWGIFFLYSIIRFNGKRNPKANYHGVVGKASLHAEVSVVIIEAVLLLGFAFPLWGKRVLEIPDQSAALRVRAIGEQYAWSFHYAGADGKFGRQAASFVSATNPLGLDPGDESGSDDVVSRNELHVVKGAPVVVEVTSKDVIHALAIPHMRVAQDAIPGTRVPLWFRPLRSGSFEIVCGQLCGAGHYAMRSHLIVDETDKFNSFIDELNAMQHPGRIKK